MEDNGTLLTPIGSEPPEFKTESDYRIKKATYASNYYEKCQELVLSASLHNLQAVDEALSRVDANDIDLAEAEVLCRHLIPLLSLDSNSPEIVLYACQLIVKLRVRKPESLWVGSADIAEKAASSFRDLSLRFVNSSHLELPPEFITVIDSWIALVKQGRLEEHLTYPLLTSALQWIFSGKNQHVRERFVSFISASYSQISQTMQDQMLHEVLSTWFRHQSALGGTNGAAAATMMELVLSLVAAAGGVPVSVWEDAVTLKSRSVIETAAHERHNHSVSVANLISRRLIDFTWSSAKTSAQRAEFQKFLAQCSRSVLSPQWPSAEVFISAFVSSLMKLITIINNQKYPGFVFDSLRTLYESLSGLSSTSVEIETGNAGDKKKNKKEKSEQPDSKSKASSLVISRAIITCLDDNQAVYLASRQCALPNQPFYDFYDAYIRRGTFSNISTGKFSNNAATTDDDNDKDNDDAKENWIKILQQYPITRYRNTIALMACDLASREDLKEYQQIELFRLLEKVVDDDPRLFRMQWLDRITYAAPAVCDSLVPVVASVYRSSRDIELLRRICSRIGGPGATQFKKRVLSLLGLVAFQEPQYQAVSHTDNDKVITLAWKYILVALTDNDATVRQSALNHAKQWFEVNFKPEMAEILVNAQLGSDKILVQRGLRYLIRDLRSTSGNSSFKIQKLVNSLLSSDPKKLQLALLFIEIDGGFTPLSQIQSLFLLATEPSSGKDGLLASRILECALRARPRIILSPAMATEMFNKFVTQLKTCSESSMDQIGSILGQLVFLGGLKTQEKRNQYLLRVTKTAFQVAENIKKSIEEEVQGFQQQHLPPPQNMAIFHQSVLICGCARFWNLPLQDIHKIVTTLVSWAGSRHIDESTKLTLIRVIFRLSTGVGTLFSEPEVAAFFDRFEQGSPEYSCLTRQLLYFMLNNDRLGTSTKMKLDFGDHKKRFLEITNEDQLRSESSVTLMLQRHVAKLIQLSQKDQDVVVLRVVVKAVEDNLVVADECIPAITSLCFSHKPDVAQTALRSFVVLCERWPRNFGVKFVEGLKMINTTCGTLDSITFSPLPLMWHVLKESQRQRNITSILNHLGQVFNPRTGFDLLELLISGLSKVDMENKDAKHLIVRIEDEISQFDPVNHGRDEIIKALIVYVFATWMRRRYGLSVSMKASGGTSVEDFDIEPMDCKSIWYRFTTSEVDVKECFNELWRLPDYYGTAKMNATVYGPSKRIQENSCSALKKLKT